MKILSGSSSFPAAKKGKSSASDFSEKFTLYRLRYLCYNLDNCYYARGNFSCLHPRA